MQIKLKISCVHLVSHMEKEEMSNRDDHEQNSVNDDLETEEKEQEVSVEDELSRTDYAVAVDESI